jgi:homoserine dehydrogenase
VNKVKVALLGLGNVGTGVWKILNTNKEEIRRRSGYDIEIAKILVRDKSKKRNVEVPEELLTDNADEVFNNDEIRIVVELMGGVEPAYEYMMRAIKSKKHLVSANKMVIATKGEELIGAAAEAGVMFYYEASVGGGIPIIHGINESLTANKIEEVVGIINGTTNYILTKMSLEGLSFDTALKGAQEKGFAEADPTSDVEAYDAMYKLAILASLSFGAKINLDSIYREGITKIESVDIAYAKELGYTIKLLAIGKDNDGVLELRVHPAMIPSTHPLANVNNSFNAIFIRGNAIGDLMLYGKGAGDLPTGSAVVGDIISILRNNIDLAPSNDINNQSTTVKYSPMEETKCEYYIRLSVRDLPGTFGEIATILGKNGVSLSSVIQKGKGEEFVPLVFVTHGTKEANLNRSLEEMKNMPAIYKIDNVIRVENL